MPRIRELKKDYLQNDLTIWLWSQIKARHTSQGRVAAALGISQESLSRKMKNNNYSFKDFITLVDMFNPDQETITKLVGGTK